MKIDEFNRVLGKSLDIKDIQSQTYKFEYDKTKKLNEQNLKPKTRGLIALVYQNYICNENEKIEYLQKSQEIIRKKEEKKMEKYNPDNIFQNNLKPTLQQPQPIPQEKALVEVKEGMLSKFIKKLKNIFHLK